MTDEAKKIIAYQVNDTPIEIQVGDTKRTWMDNTPESFAYRCLPLNIANMQGWEIPSPTNFQAFWDGRPQMDAIQIKSDGPKHHWPLSHFGSGVITFHINALFNTPPGHNLFVTGPINHLKDGIQALTGVIETDWSPYTFTMNWRFTAPNKIIRFQKGEPICAFFPIPRGYVESFEAEIQPLTNNPQLKQNHDEWSASRINFNKDLKVHGSEAQGEKWQKSYYRGYMPDGSSCPHDHQTKLRVKEFKKK